LVVQNRPPSAPRHAAPEISVVVPLFNEAENIGELYRRLSLALAAYAASYELVFVNDGSHDATPALLDALSAADAQVVIVHLSRNFGHQAAITAGLDHARGAAVVLLDGDLQDPPEVLDEFIAAWRDGHEVVYAIRTGRKEGLAKRAGYALFYRIFRAISDLDIPLDSGDFCLLDRRVVRVLRQLPERQRFVRGLRSFAGFRQTGIAYQRAGRNAGQPKYTWAGLVRLAVDGLLSFSRWPLNLVALLGLAAGFGALLASGVILAARVVQGEWASGWQLAIVAGGWFCALQLGSLAVVGEYVRRIFLEVKGRPPYIVGSVRRRGETAPRPRAGTLQLRRRAREPRPAA